MVPLVQSRIGQRKCSSCCMGWSWTAEAGCGSLGPTNDAQGYNLGAAAAVDATCVVGEDGAAVAVAVVVGVAVGGGVGSVIAVGRVGGVDVPAVAACVGADVGRGVGGSIVGAGSVVVVGGIAAAAVGIVAAAAFVVEVVGVAVAAAASVGVAAAVDARYVVGMSVERACGHPGRPRGRAVYPSGRAGSRGAGVELCHQLGFGICYRTHNNCPHT